MKRLFPQRTEAERRRRRFSDLMANYEFAYMACFLASFAVSMAIALFFPVGRQWIRSGEIILPLCATTALFGTLFGSLVRCRARRKANRYPTHVAHAEINELIFAYSVGTPERRRLTAPAIAALLDAIEPDGDSRLMPATNEDLLNLLLSEDTELGDAVSRHLYRFGLKVILPPLNSIAVGKGRAAASPQGQRRAAECIAVIEARHIDPFQEATLLRPSERPTEPTELLRASKEDQNIQQQSELLRSSRRSSD